MPEYFVQVPEQFNFNRPPIFYSALSSSNKKALREDRSGRGWRNIDDLLKSCVLNEPAEVNVLKVFVVSEDVQMW